jgi:two-component system cell cycle response regulator DivK
MKKELILIVEDNEKNLKLVRDLLQVKGYDTIESMTAEEGILLARNSQPSLVLMDIQLPGINGIEALERLRSHPDTMNIPVIALTASVMSEDRQKIIQAGFDSYLRKPIDLKEFLDEVQTIIASRKNQGN